MDCQPATIELNKLKKRNIDRLLEKKLQSPALRRKFQQIVNAHDVVDGMRNTIPNRTVQEVQQIQQNKGQAAAASKFLDEVCRYDCWAAAFLDALHFNFQGDFAEELYQDYIPPHGHDDEQFPRDSPPEYTEEQGPRSPPPEYTEIDENLQNIPYETYPKNFFISENDQLEEYARLRAKRNLRLSDALPVTPIPWSATRSPMERAVPVTCPATSNLALHQVTCAEQSDNSACDGHEAGNLERNFFTERQLNIVEASQGPSQALYKAPDSRLPADNYEIDDLSTNFAKARKLNFKSFLKEESNPSTSDTTAGLSMRNDNERVMDQKLGSVADQNADDHSLCDYLCSVEFSANESLPSSTNFTSSDIGISEPSQSVPCNHAHDIGEQAAVPNTSDHENVLCLIINIIIVQYL